MLRRDRHVERVDELLGRNPAVAILGARQVGKTTLAREIASRRGRATWFDLEDPQDLAALDEPRLALSASSGLVVIDEVQRRPELFPVLRVLIDRPDSDARFLLLGSASPDLLRQTSESLAGRIAYHRLDGFSLDEVGAEAMPRLWLRGGFPQSFLAVDDAASSDWCRSFVRTFLERDIPSARDPDPGRDAPPLLADARPLPRAGLERCRACAGLWRVGDDRSALPRRAQRQPRRKAAPTVAREPVQAAGQVAESVHCRQRAAPFAARDRAR